MAELAQPGDAATPADAPAADQVPTSELGPVGSGMSPDEAWDVVKQYESDGRNVQNWMYDPTGANSPDRLPHTASGYGQITDQNWKAYAPKLGIDVNQYPTAMSAPEDLQKKVFTAMYQKEGFAPWAPYNQRLRDYLQGRGINTQQGGGPGGGLYRRDLGVDFTSFDRDIAAARFSPQEQAAYDQMQKAFLEDVGEAKKRREEESAYAQQMAEKLKAENPQLLQWANSMPSQQAMYGASMQMAPLMAIFTALGGRATHLTGLQMLSATTGMVQGLNEASKEKYAAAMEQWKMGWEAMLQHQRVENEYYRMMLDAYAGRADAAEKAALATEKMMGNMRTEEQRRQLTAIQALRARQAAVNQANHLQYLYAALDERIKRDQDYHTRITALDNALNNSKLDQNAQAQVRMWKTYLDEDNRRIQDDLRKAQQVRQDPSLSPEDRASQLEYLDRDMATVQDMRFDHIAQLRNVVQGGMTVGGPQQRGGGPAEGGPPPAAPQGAAPPVPIQMGGGGAPAPLQAPQNLPQTDPTDPTRKLRRIPNPNPAQPLKGKIWVYASDDGSNWRPLTPQEQARADQQDKAAQPAPAGTPSAQAETQSQWGGAM